MLAAHKVLQSTHSTGIEFAEIETSDFRTCVKRIARSVRITVFTYNYDRHRSLPHASQIVRAAGFCNVHAPHTHGAAAALLRRAGSSAAPPPPPTSAPPKPMLIAAAIEAAIAASLLVLAVVVSTHSHDCDASCT